MKNSRLPLLTLTALGLFAAAMPSLAADYKFIKEIPVGGAGRFDYLIVDPAARRLYVSHGTSAVVIDIDTDKLIGEVTNTPGIHGIAFLPELGIGFTSNGRENKVSVFDLKTLATKTKIDTGANPDAILFEPGQNEVYTFNGRSSSSSVIDPKALKVVATIPLSGKPETAVADPKAGRIYDNIENKSEIAVIDTKTHSVVATWPIAPGEEPSGMAGDPEHHRIFIGCGGNNVMEMMDTTTGKVVELRAHRRRRGRQRVRSRHPACLRFLRQRHRHHRPRRFSGQTHHRSDPEHPERCAHDGVGHQNP